MLLKLSGEALSGEREWSIDPGTMSRVAGEIAAAVRQGVQVAVVVGGGNFFRGADRWPGLERASADHVGMLATVMNALCLQSALEEAGVSTRVQTAIPMQGMAEPYIRRRAIRHLERGRVVIFGAGVGSPYFTTDTAAALRAAEIGARSVLKATVVEGVFDADPEVTPGASLLRSLAFADVIQRRLCVMDQTAVTLCFENDIPIHVFSLAQPGNLLRALGGDRSIGTLVSAEGGEEAAARVAASDPAGDRRQGGSGAALAAKNGDLDGRSLASSRGLPRKFAPCSSL